MVKSVYVYSSILAFGIGVVFETFASANIYFLFLLLFIGLGILAVWFFQEKPKTLAIILYFIVRFYRQNRLTMPAPRVVSTMDRT